VKIEPIETEDAEEIRRYNLPLPSHLLTQLRIASIEKNMSIRAIILESIRLNGYDTGPIPIDQRRTTDTI
jgi:hypothetical protein